jgi:glycolate oxidase FAD binding subunit
MTVFQPSDSKEIQEVIAWGFAEGRSLDITAGGTKRQLGRPTQAKDVLDLSRLTGIVDYDRAELVLTARAATPMAEIERQLDAHQQMLAFEPPDWRGLLGSEGEPTLGGVMACNMSGPRRVRAGAARDHFLGFSAINGRGEAWKAGGRVVKNVTGGRLRHSVGPDRNFGQGGSEARDGLHVAVARLVRRGGHRRFGAGSEYAA